MSNKQIYEDDQGGETQVVLSDFSETSAILHKRPPFWSVWARRYRSTHKCISSKAALLTLLWSFIVGLTYGLVYQPTSYVSFFTKQHIFTVHTLLAILYAGDAIVLYFYPLAGFLADNKFGRYKTVVRSLYVLLVALVITFIAITILVPLLIAGVENLTGPIVAVLVLLNILFTVSFVGFSANVIQFGMDQLHDSPGDHQSLFIHWYVWLYYLGHFITLLVWNVFIYHIGIVALVILIPISIMTLISIIVSLCVAHQKQRWFLVDSARLNPYKLVHQVTKFARQHKVPVNRSAFTYCEDEVPTGLDLGKNKYGGPFTTEQVEDVKAFYGILKVLFALGLVFFLDIGIDPLLTYYANHVYNYTDGVYLSAVKEDLLNNELLSSLLNVFCVPFHLCFIRPFISKYVPGMLKRIGLGIILMVISLICTFLMDTVAHAKDRTTVSCMLLYNSTSTAALYQNTSGLVVQLSLSSLSNMLIYIALFEFICSQSPHSMKGLLIGLSFAIRGLFEMTAAAVVIPFSYIRQSFPSCGMYYYLMTLGVGMVALLVYVYVARKYKYRERDEPCNVRRYVEEYYSKTQEEHFLDYD